MCKVNVQIMRPAAANLGSKGRLERLQFMHMHSELHAGSAPALGTVIPNHLPMLQAIYKWALGQQTFAAG